MRAVSAGPPPYRDFYYPLNVFMHILTAEEGDVRYLHYGLFEHEDESIATAQERSTELLLSRLPAPPAFLLEVGIGLGTTLARLSGMGHSAIGITPDEKQIAMVHARYGDLLTVQCTSFERFSSPEQFDCIFFQESSQYIPSGALFGKARELTRHAIVIDEFAMQDEGTLHRYDDFMAAAAAHGFRVEEELDLSRQAPPTVEYFMKRIPAHRERLMGDLALTGQQVDDLVESGRNYVELYRRGVYAYRLLVFRR